MYGELKCVCLLPSSQQQPHILSAQKEPNPVRRATPRVLPLSFTILSLSHSFPPLLPASAPPSRRHLPTRTVQHEIAITTLLTRGLHRGPRLLFSVLQHLSLCLRLSVLLRLGPHLSDSSLSLLVSTSAAERVFLPHPLIVLLTQLCQLLLHLSEPPPFFFLFIYSFFLSFPSLTFTFQTGWAHRPQLQVWCPTKPKPHKALFWMMSSFYLFIYFFYPASLPVRQILSGALRAFH